MPEKQLLIERFGLDKMKAYEISTLVNSPSNDIPDVIKPFK